MIIKTVQWNIGGGKLLREGADPGLLSAYSDDGMETIIDFLKVENPDIITLQETHQKGDINQSEQIAQALGYPGWVNDVWADSHIEKGQKLGQGIVSRWPLADHTFEWFTNPGFKVTWEDGSEAMSHDKGRTYARVTAPRGNLVVQTLHTIPLRRFKINPDSEAARKMLSDIADKLASQEPGVLQADFNLDSPSLRQQLPSLFEDGFEEVEQVAATTPKGNRVDHVLYKGLRVIDSRVVTDVLTDHYPIITRFEYSPN